MGVSVKILLTYSMQSTWTVCWCGLVCTAHNCFMQFAKHFRKYFKRLAVIGRVCMDVKLIFISHNTNFYLERRQWVTAAGRIQVYSKHALRLFTQWRLENGTIPEHQSVSYLSSIMEQGARTANQRRKLISASAILFFQSVTKACVHSWVEDVSISLFLQ